MTKKRSSEFSTDRNCRFWVKIPKKVVLKFFGQMCSDEFFLKHALAYRTFFKRRKISFNVYYQRISYLRTSTGTFLDVAIKNIFKCVLVRNATENQELNTKCLRNSGEKVINFF